METENKDQKPKKRRPPNPTGKGGFRERPEAQSKGPKASQEKAREEKIAKAQLLEASREKLIEHLLSTAFHGIREGNRIKATVTCLNYLIDGKLEPKVDQETTLATKELQKSPQDLKALVKQVAIDALHDPDPRVRLTAAVAVKADLEANGELEVTKQELDEDHYQEKKLRRELQQENLKMQEKVTRMEQEMAELRGQDGLKICRLEQ